MMCGCSTGVELPKSPPPVSFSAYCPPADAFADYDTFVTRTVVKEGDTAFQTVKKFRLAEAEKNGAGRRLYNGFEQCRSKRVIPPRPKVKQPQPDAVSDILAGGF
jgi:hypothetical protein